MNSPSSSSSALWAGAAARNITPRNSQFLFGYPHVPRMSTGTHDPLLASAIYVRSGDEQILLISADLIFVTRHLTHEIRRRIAAQTGMPRHAILLAATHTHSGPIITPMASNAHDPIVPPPDPAYLAYFIDQTVAAGCAAIASAEPAELGSAVTKVTGIGSNRHDPADVSDPEVPVLVLRSIASGRILGCAMICAMHTTVLHEDSTLYSGDFAGFARRHLQQTLLPMDCPVLFFQGASGNQSPRHAVKANTLAEADRLGRILSGAVARTIDQMSFTKTLNLRTASTTISLKPRNFPSAADATQGLAAAQARLESLRAAQAPRTAVRTAECDLFGAEEAVTLARMEASGELGRWRDTVTPAEIQAFQIGAFQWVAWPGEFYVEYALEVKRAIPGSQVITLANGELQGYIVTPAAVAAGRYEAGNAVFSAENGATFVSTSLTLLKDFA